MIVKRLASVAATCAVTLGLVLGTTTAAGAAVTAKDVPSKADMVKLFPAFKKARFATYTDPYVGIPAKKCGQPYTTVRVKSARATTGFGSTGGNVSAGVAEFKSVALAKGAMAKYKKRANTCKSFMLYGTRVKLTKDKAPKLGQDRLAMTLVTTFKGAKAYSSTVIVRQGKRVATVGASDRKAISKPKLNQLARVAATKMR